MFDRALTLEVQESSACHLAIRHIIVLGTNEESEPTNNHLVFCLP